MSKNLFRILLLLVVALIFRLPGIREPLTDTQYWRQTDTASIARNYYEEGMRFYYPSVNWREDGPGYVESEFPLYPYMVALLYEGFGGVEESLGRLVSVVFGLFTVLLLYLFSFRLFKNSAMAFISGMVYAISPLCIFYNRAFMPESLMMFCSIAGLYYFYSWIHGENSRQWAGAILFLSLAMLLKLTNAMLFIPMAGILMDRHGFKFYRWGKFVIIFLLVAAFTAAWYIHAYGLYLKTHLSFGILADTGLNKWISLDTLKNFDFITTLGFRIFSIDLTPAGAIFCLLGIGAGIRHPSLSTCRHFLYAWIFAVLFYFVAVAEGNKLLEYYQLLLIPPAALFIGWFSVTAGEALKAGGISFSLKKTAVALLIFCGFLYSIKGYKQDEKSYTFRSYSFAQAAKPFIQEKGLWMVVDTEGNYDREWYDRMKHRIHRPSLMYYLNAKGWEFLPHELNDMPEKTFRALLAKGVRYMAIPEATLLGCPGIEQKIDLLQPRILCREEGFVLLEFAS